MSRYKTWFIDGRVLHTYRNASNPLHNSIDLAKYIISVINDLDLTSNVTLPSLPFIPGVNNYGNGITANPIAGGYRVTWGGLLDADVLVSGSSTNSIYFNDLSNFSTNVSGNVSLAADNEMYLNSQSTYLYGTSHAVMYSSQAGPNTASTFELGSPDHGNYTAPLNLESTGGSINYIGGYTTNYRSGSVIARHNLTYMSELGSSLKFADANSYRLVGNAADRGLVLSVDNSIVGTPSRPAPADTTKSELVMSPNALILTNLQHKEDGANAYAGLYVNGGVASLSSYDGNIANSGGPLLPSVHRGAITVNRDANFTFGGSTWNPASPSTITSNYYSLPVPSYNEDVLFARTIYYSPATPIASGSASPYTTAGKNRGHFVNITLPGRMIEKSIVISAGNTTSTPTLLKIPFSNDDLYLYRMIILSTTLNVSPITINCDILNVTSKTVATSLSSSMTGVIPGASRIALEHGKTVITNSSTVLDTTMVYHGYNSQHYDTSRAVGDYVQLTVSIDTAVSGDIVMDISFEFVPLLTKI